MSLGSSCWRPGPYPIDYVISVHAWNKVAVLCSTLCFQSHAICVIHCINDLAMQTWTFYRICAAVERICVFAYCWLPNHSLNESASSWMVHWVRPWSVPQKVFRVDSRTAWSQLESFVRSRCQCWDHRDKDKNPIWCIYNLVWTDSKLYHFKNIDLTLANGDVT